MQIERHLALNLPLFPHAPEIPAETCRSLAESDEDRLLGEGLREACGGLRRLLREKAWGRPRRAAETPGKGPREVCEGLRGAAETTAAEDLGEVYNILSQDNCGDRKKMVENLDEDSRKISTNQTAFLSNN